jgi:UDP-N-acetylmuramate: L-alanyl-gamma-D-glutamyl-meso-diaminopimelate ligase
MQANFSIRLAGRMNVRNAAMAAAAASHFGVVPVTAAAALADFKGVVHRQEVRQAGNCTLISDKASHPVALQALIESVRQMFPYRRVVSVVQPRATGGRNWVYQRELPTALAAADLVILLDAYEHNPDPGRVRPHNPFSVDLLAADLSKNKVEPVLVSGPDELPAALAAHLREGDVIVLTLPEQSSGLVTVITTVASRV